MSDFDVFGEMPASDPAADFLANQQQKLAGLMDDDFNGFGDVPPPPAPAQNQQPLPADDQQFTANDDFFMGVASTSAPLFGVDQLDDQTEAQPVPVPEFAPAPAEPVQPAPQAAAPGDAYSAIRNEFGMSDKVRAWRDAQRDRIEKKDTDENERRKQGYANAKRELEDWYKHYNDQLSKTRAANLDMEKMLIAERSEPLPTGPEQHAVLWDRVSRLCEFNPKNSKCTKDVTRFRSLLLQLKQTPPIRT